MNEPNQTSPLTSCPPPSQCLGVYFGGCARGECLEELFMRGIVTGMVDGCKEKGERSPFDSPPFAVKTVKFQIKADESTRKSTRGCRRDWWRWSRGPPRQIVSGWEDDCDTTEKVMDTVVMAMGYEANDVRCKINRSSAGKATVMLALAATATAAAAFFFF